MTVMGQTVGEAAVPRRNVAAVRTLGVDHVAMSLVPGTLTDEFRREVCDVYGDVLGWTEIEQLRLDDRMTLWAGGRTYVNIRERPEAMICTGYEHVGATVATSDDAERIHAELAASGLDVELGEITRRDDGSRSFRFRYLLPMAIEVQYLPAQPDRHADVQPLRPASHVAGALDVRPSPISGRGVFTSRALPAGEVVHVAPVLLLSEHDHDRLVDTALDGYVYDWHDGGIALALGLGSVFNHAHGPNCTYELAPEDHPMWPAYVYHTVRAVAAGEELTIDYSGGEVELWFEPAAP